MEEENRFYDCVQCGQTLVAYMTVVNMSSVGIHYIYGRKYMEEVYTSMNGCRHTWRRTTYIYMINASVYPYDICCSLLNLFL